MVIPSKSCSIDLYGQKHRKLELNLKNRNWEDQEEIVLLVNPINSAGLEIPGRDCREQENDVLGWSTGYMGR